MTDGMFGGDGQPFDPAAMNAEIDRILAGHGERMGLPAAPTPTGAPAPPEGAPAGVGGDPLTPAPAPAADPTGGVPVPTGTPFPAAPPAPVPAPSPFAGFDADDQAELLVIARGLRDPERAQAIRQAALGVQTPPPVAAPAAPPEPTLPEHVDPDSFEAQLWHQQQAQLAEVRALRDQLANQGQMSAMERARQAAQSATATLVRKYGHALSAPEIDAVCKAAAARGWVDAMIRARGGEDAPGAIEAGMTDALEAVVRSDDTLLAKVLGGPTVGIPQAADQLPPPQLPGAYPPPMVPQPQHTPEAADRQRMLTALSTGASPTGTPVQRQPIVVDHGDGGRMTEASRRALVNEVIAAGFRDQVEGG